MKFAAMAMVVFGLQGVLAQANRFEISPSELLQRAQVNAGGMPAISAMPVNAENAPATRSRASTRSVYKIRSDKKLAGTGVIRLLVNPDSDCLGITDGFIPELERAGYKAHLDVERLPNYELVVDASGKDGIKRALELTKFRDIHEVRIPPEMFEQMAADKIKTGKDVPAGIIRLVLDPSYDSLGITDGFIPELERAGYKVRFDLSIASAHAVVVDVSGRDVMKEASAFSKHWDIAEVWVSAR